MKDQFVDRFFGETYIFIRFSRCGADIELKLSTETFNSEKDILCIVIRNIGIEQKLFMAVLLNKITKIRRFSYSGIIHIE